jgi:hypothetical protein
MELSILTLALHVAYVAYMLSNAFASSESTREGCVLTHFQLDWQAIQLAVNQGHIAKDAVL